MAELYTLFAFFIGVPLVAIGWIWSCVVANTVSTKWLLAMLFAFVFALPAFALIHWQRSQGPFIVTTIGMFLLLGTLLAIP